MQATNSKAAAYDKTFATPDMFEYALLPESQMQSTSNAELGLIIIITRVGDPGISRSGETENCNPDSKS